MVDCLFTVERNKDVLCCLIGYQFKDEEALSNQLSGSQGIKYYGEKLLVAANHYKRSIFEVIQNSSKIRSLKLNAGTEAKVTMISLL
jgi:DNA helicase-2/ATP-dependent DNA helicase PcrA